MARRRRGPRWYCAGRRGVAGQLACAPGEAAVSCVVALGNFDGVHLGHQAVLRRAVQEGQRRGARVVATTFDPHPRAVLRPRVDRKSTRLNSSHANISYAVFCLKKKYTNYTLSYHL